MKKSEALKILALSDGASDDDIKQAHRKAVIANHPDKFQDPEQRAKAEEKTKLINEARDVLLSRKWTPEYGAPYANPAAGGANPFAGNPYTNVGRPGAGGSSQDPFGGFPFGGTTFVWTSWDDFVGDQTTRGSQTQGYDPFGGFNPFTGQAAPRKTSKELFEEAKSDLLRELSTIGIKAVIAVACALFGQLPLGLFIYVIISIGSGIVKRLGALTYLLIVPLLLFGAPMIVMLAPNNGGLGMGTGLFFLLSVVFDITNTRNMVMAYSKAKSALSEEDDA